MPQNEEDSFCGIFYIPMFHSISTLSASRNSENERDFLLEIQAAIKTEILHMQECHRMKHHSKCTKKENSMGYDEYIKKTRGIIRTVYAWVSQNGTS